MNKPSPTSGPNVRLQDPKDLLKKRQKIRASTHALKNGWKPMESTSGVRESGYLEERFRRLESRVLDLEKRSSAILGSMRAMTDAGTVE